jgi:hypothetical protein
MNTLKEIVQLDLERAKGLIKAVHPSPIDPQFRLANEAQEFWLAMTLSDEMGKRLDEITMLSDLMSAIQIKAYTFCAETIEPDGIFCYGQKSVDHPTEMYGFHETINRTPLEFSNRCEFTEEELKMYDKAFPRLRAYGEIVITDQLQEELEKWFGEKGKFPLVPINPKGKIKGFPSGWAKKLEICH